MKPNPNLDLGDRLRLLFRLFPSGDLDRDLELLDLDLLRILLRGRRRLRSRDLDLDLRLLLWRSRLPSLLLPDLMNFRRQKKKPRCRL